MRRDNVVESEEEMLKKATLFIFWLSIICVALCSRKTHVQHNEIEWNLWRLVFETWITINFPHLAESASLNFAFLVQVVPFHKTTTVVAILKAIILPPYWAYRNSFHAAKLYLIFVLNIASQICMMIIAWREAVQGIPFHGLWFDNLPRCELHATCRCVKPLSLQLLFYF